MANAISQRIRLEGAEEIKRLLAQIGQEAKSGFGEVEVAVARVTRTLERVSGAVRMVENSFANIGRAGRGFGSAVVELDASFGRFNTSLRRTARNLGIFTGAVVAAFEAGRRFVVGGITAGDALEEEAQALGLTTQRYQELSFAAGEAGVKQTTLATALRSLSQKIAQGKQLDTFTAKIYTVGEGTDDLTRHLMRLADQYAAMPDGPAKTARSIEDFGRAAGPKLLPLLNQGSRGIEALLAKGRELGAFLSTAGVKASADAARAFDFLALSAKGLRLQIGATFAPLAAEAATGLRDFLQANNEAIQKFARDLATKVIPYVQAFFDLLMGKETTTPEGQRLKAIADGIKMLALTVQNAFVNIIIPAFEKLLVMLDLVAAGINSVFGTSLTGGQIGVVLLVTQLLGGFTLLAAALGVAANAAKLFLNTLRLIMFIAGGVASVLRLIGVLLFALVGWPGLIAAALAAGLVAIYVYFDQIKLAAAHAYQAIKNGATLLYDYIASLVTRSVSGAWDWLVSSFDSAVNAIMRKATELASFLRGLLPGQEAGKIVPGGGGGGFASGGYTGNAGARSVAGFVHGREYVQPAWVVAQPGVRSFMEMLRRSGDLQQTIARFGRGFRDGGFVNALAAPLFPGYAAGGFVDTLAPATAGRNLGTLTLQTDAGERFQVWTDQETASSLFRVASRQRLHSAGRKPSSF